MYKPWTSREMPSQAGKVAVVTGASSGLGYEVAYALAGAGALVVLAVRSEVKANSAMAKILEDYPEAKLSFIQLDLTSLESVEDFAEEFGAQFSRLDILVNNAGVMGVPKRSETSEGYELQFGTNYLGHYALTARLLQYLVSSPSIARVINVASIRANYGDINFSDLQSTSNYKPLKAYDNSKLANLLFSFELQRRSDAGGWGLLVAGAHPGFARTNLFAAGFGSRSCVARFTSSPCAAPFGQSPEKGARSILYAATADEVVGGGYYGPKGCFELKGAVGPARIPKRAQDKEVAEKLWELSSNLAGVGWPEAGIYAVGVGERGEGKLELQIN